MLRLSLADQKAVRWNEKAGPSERYPKMLLIGRCDALPEFDTFRMPDVTELGNCLAVIDCQGKWGGA